MRLRMLRRAGSTLANIQKIINNHARLSKEAQLKEVSVGFWILGIQTWTAAVTLLHALVATEGLGREQATEGWAGMRNPERSLERLVHFQGVEV